MSKTNVSKAKSSPRKGLQVLDRTAIGMMVVLAVAIALILFKGDRTAPVVREFSWNNRQVGAEDTAFLLTFSRPMERASVEKNLQVAPPLPGKFSWAGRRMAYTLEHPAPYGKTFEVKLQGSRDRFSDANDPALQPFTGKFTTRDSAFVYLGVEGKEEGRLVLQNLTKNEQVVLTPENLVVMDFQPYPEGDRILFSALERSTDTRSPVEQKLFTVTTGIQLKKSADTPGTQAASSPAKPREQQPVGMVDLLLDNKDYQNLKFDLAPNGKTIVVQRVNRQNLGDLGLWMLKPGEQPTRIKTDPGGDFLITPDSGAIAMSQGQGMGIIPIAAEAERLDFLPKFGVVLNFAKDGSAAAMVKFNRDPQNPSQSLFLVTNQGTEKELVRVPGAILTAQFDPMNQNLYCLMTQRIVAPTYTEQPYLTSVNLKTGERTDLLKLPIQRDIQMSLAPDGLGILFDQVVSANDPKQQNKQMRDQSGKAIATSRLWFLPTALDDKGNTLSADPQELGIAGLRPRWLP